MKVISTTQINFEIELLIKESEEYLVLLSPYLRIGQKLKNLLAFKINSINQIFVICRLSDISKSEMQFFKLHQKIKLIDSPRLHAKCYLNERKIILTSMNLYDFSQINNFELGIIFNKKEHPINYRTILWELNLLLNSEDEKNNELKMVLDKIVTFQFSELTTKIIKNYIVPHKNNFEIDNQYKIFSQEAMKIYRFKKTELYQDNSAVLRNTLINQKIFNFLYKSLTSQLKRKK